MLADDRDRRGLATADARSGNHAHTRSEPALQRGEQRARARKLAGNRIADADRDRGRWRLALFHHVEVVVNVATS